MLMNGAFNIIGKVLPNNTKRIVLLSTLAANIVDIKYGDDEIIHKLNDLLLLCNDDNALKLPITLSKVIWKYDDTGELSNIYYRYNNSTFIVKGIVTKIISKIPKWLMYDNTDIVKIDIEELLNACNTLRHA